MTSIGRFIAAFACVLGCSSSIAGLDATTRVDASTTDAARADAVSDGAQTDAARADAGPPPDASRCPGGRALTPRATLEAPTTFAFPWGVFLHAVLRVDDRRLVAGVMWDEARMQTAFGLAAVDDRGRLDARFGPGGTGFGLLSGGAPAWRTAWAATRDPAGRIVLAGSSEPPDDRVLWGTVMRTSARGELDASFGLGGLAVHQSRASAGGRPVVWLGVLADGAGIAVVGTDDHPRMLGRVGRYARLRDDGALDADFGEGVTTDPRFRSFSAVMRDGDGYVLVGETADAARPALLFLDARGRPRNDRGDRGVPSPPARAMVVRAAVRDRLGGIVAAGGMGAGVPGQTRLAAVRFLADGTADLDFGERGFWLSPVNATWDHGEVLSAGLDTFCDGRLLISGRWGDGLVAHRLDVDGALDETAGGGGVIDFGNFKGDVSFTIGVRVEPDQSLTAWSMARDGRTIRLQHMLAN